MLLEGCPMGNYVQCANCWELIDLDEEEAVEERDDSGFPILICAQCGNF